MHHKTLLASLAILGISATASAQDMIGVSWSGTVYTIDSTTGSGSFLASSGFSSLNSMAIDGSGTVYVAGGLAISDLISIDSTTGAGTFLGSTGINSIRGMAFNPGDGLLYCIQDNGIGNPDDLYTLNVTNLAASFVGSTAFPGLQGLTFTSDGRLWSWDVGSGSGIGDALIELNPATGLGTNVNPGVITSSVSNFQFLTSDGAGNLYGGRDSLYRIDTATSNWSFIGSGGYSDLRGADFTSFTPPNCATVYCTPKVNSLGCTPSITADAGCPSASTNYNINVDTVLNNKAGIIFYGTGPNNIPFQGGFLCVNPPIQRTAVQTTGGNPPPNDCSGTMSIDMNSLGLTSGVDYYFQGWSRDPASPSTTSLTEGVQVVNN